jgi:hypothetical protein
VRILEASVRGKVDWKEPSAINQMRVAGNERLEGGRNEEELGVRWDWQQSHGDGIACDVSDVVCECLVVASCNCWYEWMSWFFTPCQSRRGEPRAL